LNKKLLVIIPILIVSITLISISLNDYNDKIKIQNYIDERKEYCEINGYEVYHQTYDRCEMNDEKDIEWALVTEKEYFEINNKYHKISFHNNLKGYYVGDDLELRLINTAKLALEYPNESFQDLHKDCVFVITYEPPHGLHLYTGDNRSNANCNKKSIINEWDTLGLESTRWWIEK